MDKIFLQGSNYYLICILCFAMLLSGCWPVARKDGPPNYYVDASKIPDAIPKIEPPAKYGNMNSYRVFGKRYFVLKSSKYYDKVGTASWYGTKFHTLRTSSGESYNMLAMTAAHKTLPLPTYVEVTNLHNQRKIVVKVNDRGPFAANRLIDLSYVAAKKLGMLGHGTTTVRVKAIDPYKFLQQQELIADIKKDLTNLTKPIQLVYLQVGQFKNKLYAEKLRQRLTTLFATPIRISSTFRKNHLYHVKIGPFKDIAIVNKITLKLKSLGIKSNKVYGG